MGDQYYCAARELQEAEMVDIKHARPCYEQAEGAGMHFCNCQDVQCFIMYLRAELAKIVVDYNRKSCTACSRSMQTGIKSVLAVRYGLSRSQIISRMSLQLLF